MQQNVVAAGSYNFSITPKFFCVFSYAPAVGIFMWKSCYFFLNCG